MRKVNLPKPEFETSRNSIRLIFKYASINNSTVIPQLEKLIKTVGTMSLGPKEIMTIMGLKDKRIFLEKYLYPSIEANIVEPVNIVSSKSDPNQKYRLTEKGKTLLK